MEIVSYCTKRGRMSGKLGIGEIPFHHQAMSGDIDIQDHRYRMSRRTFSNPGKNVPGIMYADLRGAGWLYVLEILPQGDLPL